MTEPHREAESDVLHLMVLDGLDGRTSDVQLRFTELHGRPHVLFPMDSEPRWVSATRAASLVRWRIGSHDFVGAARVVEHGTDLQTEVLTSFHERFGQERMSRWFGGEVGCIVLVESTVLPAYYDQVEALFDQAAPSYSRLVEGNRLNMHLRKVSSGILRTLFPAGSRVLEIGCGTGIETIPLARAGVDIVALDISGRMLEELDRSARAASVRERIDSRKRSASELATIVREYGPGSFDGAFSHFGALNCEPNLEPVPNALHELVKPNGKLSLGILNRTCLAEIVLFAAGHRPRRALARLQPSVPVGQSRFGVAVFPYGPVEITRRFSPFFSKEKEIGVSVCVPPPELGNRLLTHNTFLSLLEAVDRSLARWPFFRRLGDYVMMQFSRR